MKRAPSWLWAIMLVGLAGGAFVAGAASWNNATHSKISGIERIIEADREHFRSMQPVWDKMEDENPEFVRPTPTTAEEYQRWRDWNRKAK